MSDLIADVAQGERIAAAHRLFAETAPRRLFFKAALPGSLSMLCSALYDMSDGILVGQLLGESAFAAVGLAMPFVIIAFAFGDLIGVGSSVPIAIALGEGDHKRANNIFTCSAVMIELAAVVLGGTLWVLAPLIMAAMGATGDVARMATLFLRVYAFASPLTTILFAADNYLRICGRIKTSMGINVLMSVLGAVVEFSLLYFTDLGVVGAALGYCVALATASIVAMAPFAAGRMLLRFVRPRLSASLVREVVIAGMPAFLGNVAGRVTSILLNASLLELGGERAVSVFGMLMYVSGFVYSLIYGMCDSLQPAVGYNWGAHDYGRMRSLERWCFSAAALVGVALSVVPFLLPGEVTHLFMAQAHGELLAMATEAFQIFSLTYVFRWFALASMSFLTATEKSKAATILSLAQALVCPVVVLVALRPLGLMGLWLNAPVSALVTSLGALGLLMGLRHELHLTV
ncbi:Na+-driven multidrug efflux pump [Olsenella profusa DSM 13989]|uniref:MATE family efflux transporter n=1 Tax=Olsenella profusa TaxID=138595 RepID=UPI00277F5AEA|nr:MATE family efflux transporter [Olsenella profusa]MDP9859873.1 Na+-driven multidrug efflux pump [Olsenella profusa DSM 13989]